MITVLELDAVESNSFVSEGSGLKYPAVNVQDEDENWGRERVRNSDVMAGSSVEVSGFKRDVSCESG